MRWRSRPRSVVGFPTASGSRARRALERAGFRLSHVRGSHRYLVKPSVTKSWSSSPIHGNRDLPKGTLRSNLRQAGMTPEQLAALLRRIGRRAEFHGDLLRAPLGGEGGTVQGPRC